MPRIATIRSKGQSNEDVISLVLSQDAVSAGFCKSITPMEAD